MTLEELYNELPKTAAPRPITIEIKKQIANAAVPRVQNTAAVPAAEAVGASSAAVLLQLIREKGNYFLPLLSCDDGKTRRNAALIIGQLGLQDCLPALWKAYEDEDQLMIRSSYLMAMRELDYRSVTEGLKEHLKEVRDADWTPETTKHLSEELRLLQDMVLTIGGIRPHTYTGWDEVSELILLTNRECQQITADEVMAVPKKTKEDVLLAKCFGPGVRVRTNLLRGVLACRTYSEALFLLPGCMTCPIDPKEAAEALYQGGLLQFLETRHEEAAPFMYRLELKVKEPENNSHADHRNGGKPEKPFGPKKPADITLDKGEFARRFSAEMDRISGGSLINSVSHYEMEIRLIPNRSGNFNVLVRLFTIPDDRFAYYREHIAAGMRPETAALLVRLGAPYMKEGARVLDPFCGVGTLLIERARYGKLTKDLLEAGSTAEGGRDLSVDTLYGVDIFGDAIRKARVNAEEAGLSMIHYVNRDVLTFTHEYRFDEVISDLPAAGPGSAMTGEEAEELFGRFFAKAASFLSDDAVMILYCRNLRSLMESAERRGWHAVQKTLLNQFENSYCVILSRNPVGA